MPLGSDEVGVCWLDWNPESGTVRYNRVVRQEWPSDSLGACRGVVLTSQATLFDGTP